MNPKDDDQLINALKIWAGKHGFAIDDNQKLTDFVGMGLKAIKDLEQIASILGYSLDEIEPAVKEIMREYEATPASFVSSGFFKNSFVWTAH